MSYMRSLAQHPSHALDDLSDEIAHHARSIAKRPAATGGVIMLILGVLCFIWLFPELRRYLRIERM